MNSRLVALQNKRAALAQEADQILELVANEDREPTAEEQASIDERMAEIDKLTNRINLEERLANQRAGIERNGAIPTDAGLINRNALRRREQQSAGFQGENALGEMLIAVARASISHGQQIDPRLTYVNENFQITAATGSGLYEGSPADGGFLVQQEVASDLMRRAFETGKLVSKVRRIPIGAGKNGLKINAVLDNSRVTGARYGGLQLYWTEEGGLKTPSAPKFRQMSLNLKKLVGLMYATDEVLEDAVALGSVINDVFPEEFGFVLDDAFVEGTGSGMPLGYLNSPALITVAAEGGQTADTIVFNNILKMYSRFWTTGKNNGNGLWLVGTAAIVQLMQMSAGGTATVYGLPVFIPPGGVSGKPYGTIMGLPMLEIEQASALGDVGDISLVDPSQYLMIDKGGIKQAVSMHVRFIYDEQTFRFVYRCDGQPTWDTPVTPFKGTDTISPFVTLAAR